MTEAAASQQYLRSPCDNDFTALNNSTHKMATEMNGSKAGDNFFR